MSSSTVPGEVRADEGGRRGLMRLAIGAAGLLALELIAHRAALATNRGGLAALAPLLLPGAMIAWVSFRSSAPLGLAALALLAGLGSLALLSAAAAHLLALICQLAVCLAIGGLFGHSLAPGAVPLVTQMARAVHGALPPRIEAYTRHVTIAWTLFMILLCVLSILLFVCAPLHVWSLFANLLVWPLVGLMFLAEYAYRTWRYGWFSHATLAESVSAFQRLRAARRRH